MPPRKRAGTKIVVTGDAASVSPKLQGRSAKRKPEVEENSTEKRRKTDEAKENEDPMEASDEEHVSAATPRSLRARKSTGAGSAQNPASKGKGAVKEPEKEEELAEGDEGLESAAEADDPSDDQDFPSAPRRSRRSKAAMPSSAAEDDNASEEEKEEKAAPAKKRAGRGGAKKKRSAEGDDGEQTLYDIILEGSASLDAVAAQWAAGSYARDREGAVTDLVNLMMQAGGYPPNAIPREAIENPDEHDISDEIEALNARVENDPNFTPTDYPLISKKHAARGKAAAQSGGNRFARNYRDFWTRWVLRMRIGVVSKKKDDADDGKESDAETWAWEVVKVWSHQLSTSPIRNIRHAAAATGLGIMAGLVELGRQIVDNEAGARRLADAEKKGGRKKDQAEARAAENAVERSNVEEEVMAYFDGIFVHRYRDVDATIRADCSRELGASVLRLPEVFLDPTYLRYIGWALSDKSANVRLEPLRSLHRLFCHSQAATLYIPGVRQFTERFRPRLLDCARGDIDHRCREEALKACAAAAHHGLMDDDTARNALLAVAVGTDANSAALVGPFMAGMIEEEGKELESVAGAGDDTSTKAAIKSACMTIARACEAASRQEKGVSVFGSQSQQSQSLSQSSQVASGGDGSGESWDLGPEGADAVLWLKEEAGPFGGEETSMARVKSAVAAVWDEVEVLRDVPALCDHLLAESSSRSRGPLRLTATEEAILAHLIPVSLEAISAEGDVGKEASQHLLKALPGLLARYSGVPGEGERRLEALVSSIERMDLSVLAEAKHTKAVETLMSGLVKIFSQHEDMRVLREIAVALKRLIGSDANSETAKSAKRKKVPSARSNDRSGAGVSSAARRQLRELLEELLSALTLSIEDLGKSIEDDDLTLASAEEGALPARAALKRILALAQVIDVGHFIAEEGEDDFGGRLRQAFDTLRAFRVKATDLPAKKSKGKQVVRSQLRIAAAVGEELQRLRQVIDGGVESCMQILFLDTLWTGIALSKAGLANKSEAEEIEDDDAEGEGARKGSRRKDKAVEDTEEERKKFQELVENLWGALEIALKVNVEEAGDDGSFHVRCSAVRVLGDLALLLDGNIGLLVPEAASSVFPLPAEVQEGIATVVGQLIEVASGLKPSRFSRADETYNMGDEEDIDSGSMGFKCPFERHVVSAVARQLERMASIPVKLLVYDRMEPRFGSTVLKWVGVAAELTKAQSQDSTPASSPPQTLEPFFWSTVIGTNLCKHLVSELGRNALQGVAEVVSEKAKGKASTADAAPHRDGKRTKAALEEVLSECVLESLDESLDFFFSGRLPSIEHSMHLAKVVSTELKTWAGVYTKAPAYRREAAVDASVAFLRKAADLAINRISDCVRSSTRVSSHLRGHNHLTEAAQVWRPWAVVADGMAVALGITDGKDAEEADHRDKERVMQRIRDGVLSDLKDKLHTKNLKPGEGPEWGGYYAFVGALEGKSGEEKKKRAKKAGSTTRAPKAPGTKGPKRKRAPKKSAKIPKPLKFVAGDDESETADQDDEALKVTPGSRRRYAAQPDEEIEDDVPPPARKGARSRPPKDDTASETEGTDEDGAGASEEEPEPAPIPKPRKPVKQMQLLDEDEEEEAHDSAEEDEDLPDVQEVLKGKARDKRAVGVKGSKSPAPKPAGRKRKNVEDSDEEDAGNANGHASDDSQDPFQDEGAPVIRKKKRIT